MKKLFALLLIAFSATVALPSFGGLGPKKLPRKPHAVKSMAATAKKARKVVLAKPTIPASDTEALANVIKKAVSKASDVREFAVQPTVIKPGKCGTPGPIESITTAKNHQRGISPALQSLSLSHRRGITSTDRQIWEKLGTGMDRKICALYTGRKGRQLLSVESFSSFFLRNGQAPSV